jgi:hypothetical protein
VYLVLSALGAVRARHAVAAVGDFLGVLYGEYRRVRTDVSGEQLDGGQQGGLSKQVSQ